MSTMRILLKIAWRNIWRNPRRTWVLITSIAVGVIGYAGTTSFSRGFLNQMIESSINLQGGHIMIAARGHQENPHVRRFIADPERVEARLQEVEGVQYAPFVAFQGMISSSEAAAGVRIHGVLPEQEAAITVISRSITQGRYLQGESGSHEIIIGEALARKLNVALGEKIVIMMSDLENEISSAAYRVVGLFETASPGFDKMSVYLSLRQAQDLVGYQNEVTGFVLRLQRGSELEPTVQQIKSFFTGGALEVLSWKDRNPLLVLSIQAYDSSLVIIVTILFIAIAFSIANAFLMVIYERMEEIGIMMANGVLPRNIRRLLLCEALFVSLLGIGVGALFSALALSYLGRAGLNLGAVSAGLGKFGVGAIVYPEMAATDVAVGLGVIVLVVSLSVLYPAVKASRFEVVDAIRFV